MGLFLPGSSMTTLAEEKTLMQDAFNKINEMIASE